MGGVRIRDLAFEIQVWVRCTLGRCGEDVCSTLSGLDSIRFNPRFTPGVIHVEPLSGLIDIDFPEVVGHLPGSCWGIVAGAGYFRLVVTSRR